MNIEECAAKYAAERANKVFVYALAEAYKDGYRDGYNDHKANPMAELVNDYDEVEYVDLGLPSGTLWSKDYLRKDGKTLYLPFCEAKKFTLPTEEHWKELVNHSSVTGMTLDFKVTYKWEEIAAYSFGSRIGKSIIFDTSLIRFWLAEQATNCDKGEYVWWYRTGFRCSKIYSSCIGDKNPVRLVKQKED